MIVLIIILSINIFHLKESNDSLNIIIKEQKQTIKNLNNENATLKEDINRLTAEKTEENNQENNVTKKTEQPNAQTPTQNTSLGQFKITAYCNCSKCCGKWAGGKTASGTTPTAGRTIAVDPSVIPLGSRVIIDGHTYVAEDTGSAIKGNKIDMYFNSHSEALNWGVKYKNISIVK